MSGAPTCHAGPCIAEVTGHHHRLVAAPGLSLHTSTFFWLACCCCTCSTYTQEEKAKRAARAIKFGLPDDRQAGLAYAPDPEEHKRRQRAQKFGTNYQPPSADTLLQKAGEWGGQREHVGAQDGGGVGCVYKAQGSGSRQL